MHVLYASVCVRFFLGFGKGVYGDEKGFRLAPHTRSALCGHRNVELYGFWGSGFWVGGFLATLPTFRSNLPALLQTQIGGFRKNLI